MTSITVIDSIMGSGKTSWAIQYMSEANENKRFIYITPFLDEVKRVKREVTNRTFSEPIFKNGDTKLDSLKELLVQGVDIVSTHALFKKIDDETVQLLKDSGYTLILDEVMGVIEKVDSNHADVRLLRQKANYIEIQDDGKVIWKGRKDDSSRYSDIRLLAQANTLYCYRKESFFVWVFPPYVFKLFEDVYILTYLFDGQIQRYYYDYFKLNYQYKSLEKIGDSYRLCEYDKKRENREEFYKLIDIYEGKLNELGERKNSLSASWLRRSKPNVIKQLGNNVYNFFQNICNVPSQKAYYTVLSEINDRFKPKGYTKRFVPFNIRATNDYIECEAVAFVYNRYASPYELVFFQSNGVRVNEEMLAVSDLLQFLWRSQLREGKKIKAYIPSSRMRELLLKWSKYEL